MIARLPKPAIVTAVLMIVGGLSIVAAFAQSDIQAEDGKITANLRDIQVTEILKILAEKSEYDFIISGGITGTVTLYVKNMDPLQVLDVIAELANIAYAQEGNVIKVYSADRYRQIYNEEFVDKRVTQTIRLEHIDISAVAQSVQALKSPKGTVVADANSNSLIITDNPASLSEIKRVIASLDVPLHSEVITLQHASAGSLVETIRPYASSGGSVQVNESTNQIIVSDTETGLKRMRDIVAAFDVPAYVETEVFHLKYPQHATLVAVVEQEVTAGGGKMTFDEASNSAVVSAIPEEMAKVRRILGSVDRGAETVLIEAKLLQIVLNDDFRMGVNWQYVNSRLDSLGVAGVFNVLVPGSGGATVMGGNLNDNNYHFLIEALQTIGNTDLLSSPRIMAVEGVEARILVGGTVPYKTTDTREEQGTIRTFEVVTNVEVGVKLIVTPQVNEDGTVVMDVLQEVSTVAGFRDGVPEISKSESQTTVSVPDGVTVVMAGLIQDERITIVNQVPLLGSIPLLGHLFKSTEKQNKKSEILVFLTPYVTQNEARPEDLQKLYDYETGSR